VTTPANPLDKCPSATVRCPHKRLECEHPNSKTCVHIWATKSALASFVASFRDLPAEIQDALTEEYASALAVLSIPKSPDWKR